MIWSDNKRGKEKEKKSAFNRYTLRVLKGRRGNNERTCSIKKKLLKVKEKRETKKSRFLALSCRVVLFWHVPGTMTHRYI